MEQQQVDTEVENITNLMEKNLSLVIPSKTTPSRPCIQKGDIVIPNWDFARDENMHKIMFSICPIFQAEKIYKPIPLKMDVDGIFIPQKDKRPKNSLVIPKRKKSKTRKCIQTKRNNTLSVSLYDTSSDLESLQSAVEKLRISNTPLNTSRFVLRQLVKRIRPPIFFDLSLYSADL
jgi:hypothetical protein